MTNYLDLLKYSHLATEIYIASEVAQSSIIDYTDKDFNEICDSVKWLFINGNSLNNILDAIFFIQEEEGFDKAKYYLTKDIDYVMRRLARMDGD